MASNRLPILLMSIVGLLWLAVASVAAQDVFGTVVACDNANIRIGAGHRYAVLTTATPGEDLKLIGRNADNSWLQVSLFSNRRAGWVRANCIETGYNINLLTVAVPTGADAGFVNTNALNLRKGPGANFDILMTLNIRAVFDAIGRNADNSWVKVRVNGMEGWLSTRYAVLHRAINRLPVVNETGIAAGLPDPLPVNNQVVGFLTMDATVYYGPGDFYAALTTVNNGAGVFLRGRSSDVSWLLVQLDNGDIGWISASMIRTDYPLIQLGIVGNS